MFTSKEFYMEKFKLYFTDEETEKRAIEITCLRMSA